MHRPPLSLPLLGLVSALALTAATAAANPTWELVYSEPNQDNALMDVEAVDGQTAWAVGVSSNMGNSQPVGVRTTDGVSWSPIFLPSGSGGQMEFLFFTSLAFNDESVGFVHGLQVSLSVQQSILWRTDNGGMSWTEAFRPNDMVEQLQALAAGSVYAAAGSRVVLSWDGQSFQEAVPPLPTGMRAVGIHMMNDTCGYLVAAPEDENASRSAILWTDQGGASWEVRAENVAARLRRAWFVDANLGWAAGTNDRGGGVVASTYDGGRNWSVTDMPDHPPAMGSESVPVTDCLDVRFFDDLRGLALCSACTGNCDGSTEDNPTLMTAFFRTSDGGVSWQMDADYEPVMTAPPFGDMMKYSGMLAMAFPGPNQGFLAGQNNLVLRFDAASPEPAGWGPPSCYGGTGGNSGTGGGSGTGASSASGSAADADDEGGCGCRAAGSASPQGRAAGLLLAGTLALAARRRRRDATRP